MSKRAPYEYGEDLSGQKYWKSLSEFEGTPEFKAATEREFPDGASELDPVSRRSFMKLMGASAGLAGVVACRRPEEKIMPYSRAPEHLVPGNPDYYATALAWGGTAYGLLVESHEGRPTKVEGNPRHPESLGATHAFAQALALEIYDTDRSRAPQEKGTQRSWTDASVALGKLGEAAKANGGAKLVILTESHRSPTLNAVLAEVKAALPQARVVRYSPLSNQNARTGLRAALGRDVEAIHSVKGAKVVAALDADILGDDDGAVRNSRAFADGRKLGKPGDAMNRLYVVESRMTVTGASADHRLRVPSRDVTEFAYALAAELAATHGLNLGEAAAAVAAFKGQKFESKKPWVKALARDLAQNKGACVVVAGRGQPAAVHAVVAAINIGLENVAKTVTYVPAWDGAADGPEALAELAQALGKGDVDTLLILGGNPVFHAQGDVDFAGALKRAANTVHLSFEFNETSDACAWHLNRAHDLESWSDVRAQDGTLSVVQPLIAPIFDGKTDAEVLTHLLGTPRKAHDLVKGTWQKTLNVDDKTWRRALHEGVHAGSAYPVETPTLYPADVAKLVTATPPAKEEGFEVTFHADSHAWDGRFANNGWMQELPDPMTKLTWDNAALMSWATAKKLGVAEGDLVTVSLKGGKSVALPAVLAHGQAEDSVAIAVGQGRTKIGLVGEGVGFNTYVLRTTANAWMAQGAQIQKAGGEPHKLARTQEHASMEGRPLVRETTLGKWNEEPDFAQKMVKHPPLLSLFPDREYTGHKWGMVVDLNACTGCGVCMVSCQAENNIPLVGKWGVAMSREMHWIRVDRYFSGHDTEDPAVVFQPLPCQQCELAPCEQVCPVAATTHSPEGLNDMAYNRCVGTRYCANNCPYKVRRFNFHNYSKDFSSIKTQMKVGQFFKKDYQELRRMQFNPDVTVRERGVMEKCTYCVQRINQAKIAGKRDARDLKDGDVVSACQQACPSGAIHFGDLNLKGSDVAQNAESPRNYGILAELNTRPRTTYLAKVRNPNRELEV